MKQRLTSIFRSTLAAMALITATTTSVYAQNQRAEDSWRPENSVPDVVTFTSKSISTLGKFRQGAKITENIYVIAELYPIDVFENSEDLWGVLQEAAAQGRLFDSIDELGRDLKHKSYAPVDTFLQSAFENPGVYQRKEMTDSNVYNEKDPVLTTVVGTDKDSVLTQLEASDVALYSFPGGVQQAPRKPQSRMAYSLELMSPYNKEQSYYVFPPPVEGDTHVTIYTITLYLPMITSFEINDLPHVQNHIAALSDSIDFPFTLDRQEAVDSTINTATKTPQYRNLQDFASNLMNINGYLPSTADIHASAQELSGAFDAPSAHSASSGGTHQPLPRTGGSRPSTP